MSKRDETGWDFIDLKTQSWDYVDVPRTHAWALIADRYCTSKLQIFLKFIDENILTAIFNSEPSIYWTYQSSKKQKGHTYYFARNLFPKGKFNLKQLYFMYSHVVRIFGLQNKLSESDKNKM